MAQPRYEIVEGKAGHYVRIVAANNEVVMVSESYSSRSAAERAVHNVRRIALEEATIRIEEAEHGS